MDNWWLGLLPLVGFFLYLLYVNATSLIELFRPGTVFTDFSDDARIGERASSRPDVRKYLEELERLGFHPIGCRWEKGGPLGRRLWEISLASKTGECFASIGIWKRPANFYLLTAFTNGAVILTGANLSGAEVETDELIYGGIPHGSPNELLVLHRERVKRFVDKGASPARDVTREGRLAACRAYYHTAAVRKRMRQQALMGLVYLAVMGAILAHFLYRRFSRP